MVSTIANMSIGLTGLVFTMVILFISLFIAVVAHFKKVMFIMEMEKELKNHLSEENENGKMDRETIQKLE